MIDKKDVMDILQKRYDYWLKRADEDEGSHEADSMWAMSEGIKDVMDRIDRL